MSGGGDTLPAKEVSKLRIEGITSDSATACDSMNCTEYKCAIEKQSEVYSIEIEVALNQACKLNLLNPAGNCKIDLRNKCVSANKYLDEIFSCIEEGL